MHFGAGEVYFGGGMYMPDAKALGLIRDAIVKQPAAWKAVKADKSFHKVFGGLGGDDVLTRAPRGYDPAHPLIEDIKRKSSLRRATPMSNSPHRRNSSTSWPKRSARRRR